MWDSKKTSHVLRGRRAQASGASFENIFSASCAAQAIAVSQIPNGCRTAGKRLIRVKTPFDWVISKNGKCALIDTKTINAAAFPHALIEPHQALSMLRHDLEGIRAGYLVWLRKTNTLIFISARVLCDSMQSRGSIGPDNPKVISIGSMESMSIQTIFDSI